MSRTSALILLGILVILIPFSGLPIALRTMLSVICGVAVLGIGLMLRTHEVQSKSTEAVKPPAPPAIG